MAQTSDFLLALSCILLVHPVFVQRAPETEPEAEWAAPNSSNWDFLIFTQEWPQASCIDYRSKDDHRTCVIFSNVTSWTVHGIWPTKAGTRGPHNCLKLPFDLSKLSQLESSLLEHWPNVYGGKSVYSLWEHEWTKHGTCAAELPSIGDERDYFALGLEWVAQYQMLSVLSSQGISPGPAAYSWEQIRGALRSRFNKHMVVDCILDKETRRWYLSQVKICLDKTLQLTDCHHKVQPITTGCPEEGILYPPIEPTHQSPPPAPSKRTELDDSSFPGVVEREFSVWPFLEA